VDVLLHEVISAEAINDGKKAADVVTNSAAVIRSLFKSLPWVVFNYTRVSSPSGSQTSTDLTTRASFIARA
jgi:hypothetical protein